MKNSLWKRGLATIAVATTFLLPSFEGAAHADVAAKPTAISSTGNAVAFDAMNGSAATSATCRRRRVTYYRRRRVTYVSRRPRNSHYVGSRIVRYNGRRYRVRYYRRNR